MIKIPNHTQLPLCPVCGRALEAGDVYLVLPGMYGEVAVNERTHGTAGCATFRCRGCQELLSIQVSVEFSVIREAEIVRGRA